MPHRRIINHETSNGDCTAARLGKDTMKSMLTLGLCLASAASWAVAGNPSTPQPPEAKSITASARPAAPALGSSPSRTEMQALVLAQKTRALAGPAAPGKPAPLRGSWDKEERLARWSEMPALDAYRLFKELGRELPAELALRFNSSLVATPWTPDFRQAGGSPGTAVVIDNTTPGATFSDHGNTTQLSNYLGAVAGTNSLGCPATVGFDANDGWYQFTLAQATQVTATTCAADYHYDSRLGLFTTGLEQLAGNDDDCQVNGLQSSVACCLDPGTYYLVVDGFATYAGEYDLGVSFADCPAETVPTHGGPDAFGCTWADSNAAAGPDYGWVDISGMGTPVALSDDSYAGPFEIGFPFPFYGEAPTQVYIGSNGLLGFADSPDLSSLSNTGLPNADAPNGIICAFWDDLNPGAGGSVRYYGDAGLGRFIVQFTDVPAYGGSVPMTFQVILSQGGDVLVRYLDLDENDLTGATVGMENAAGDAGLQVNLNGAGAAIGDGVCVRLFAPHPSGGSGGGGYAWSNSLAAGGPVFNWVDISGATDLGLSGDDETVVVNLPFAFPFQGAVFTSVAVCSNGWVGFNTSDEAEYYNVPIPTAGEPDNAIFALWDDLYLPEGGAVYYFDDSANGRVFFQWHDIPHISSSDEHFTFQAILDSNGDVTLQYLDVPEGLAASSSVGLENGDGSVGLQALYMGVGTVLRDGLALRFRAPQPRPTRGGPDAGGYAWVNSLDAGGPVFQWTDISATGTNLGLTGDDQTTAVTLPWSFPFYGAAQTQLQVCSNGYLSFGDTGAYFTNVSLPQAFPPNNIICPFWDDLFPPSGGAVYYLDDSAAGRVIVQWHAIPHIGGSVPYTFQAQLYQTGEIYVYYLDMDEALVSSATVGVENSDGSVGLQVNFDDTGGLIADGLALQIYNSQLDVATPRAARPEAARLGAPWPNPFNPETRVELELASAGDLRLAVYDLLGRQQAVLHEGALAAGSHDFTWHPEAAAAGVYFIVLSGPGGDETRRVIYLP